MLVLGRQAREPRLLTIDGKVTGNLKASAHWIVLNGEVTGDTRPVADQIELGPTARIGGALHHASREFKKADGAVVAGALTQDEPAEQKGAGGRQWEHSWHYSGPSWVGLVLGYLGLLVASAVFVLLLPKFSAQAPQRIGGTPWLSLSVGFGVLAGVPVLALLLFITLLGIPLGLAALSLHPLLLLAGYLSGVAFVAQKAGAALRTADTRSFTGLMGLVVIALLALMLIGRLPLVGPLSVFLTTIAGLGAGVPEWQQRRGPTQAPRGCLQAVVASSSAPGWACARCSELARLCSSICRRVPHENTFSPSMSRISTSRLLTLTRPRPTSALKERLTVSCATPR